MIRAIEDIASQSVRRALMRVAASPTVSEMRLMQSTVLRMTPALSSAVSRDSYVWWQADAAFH